MLHINVPKGEYYDDDKQEFIQVKAQALTMEHSLISISKWEAIWKKPFLDEKPKTIEEILSYYQCMTITPNVDPVIYQVLSQANIEKINDYIKDNRSATTFYQNSHQPGGKKETLTSELIYFYMAANSIPSDYEKWHLSRLIALLRICSIKNNPKQKKMSKNAVRRQNQSLNAARRAKYNTNG